MRKLLLSKKGHGFTLVELMIVVAIIALLILVLLPRIGVIKNKAREAGLRSNMVMLEGIVDSVIDDFDVATDTPAAVEARIAGDILAATTVNQQLKNPFTAGTGVGATFAGATASTVAAYSPDDDLDTGNDAVINTIWLNNAADKAGNIAFCAREVGTKYQVKLIPYGADSKRITKLEKIISQ